MTMTKPDQAEKLDGPPAGWQSVATLDQISGGRFILGVAGCGQINSYFRLGKPVANTDVFERGTDACTMTPNSTSQSLFTEPLGSITSSLGPLRQLIALVNMGGSVGIGSCASCA